MIKLIKFPTNNNLGEIFQSIEIKFAFINKDYEQIHQPVICRDFLGDIIWSKYIGRPVDLYGFTYEYKLGDIEEEVLRLSIKFPNMSTKETFIDNISALWEKEEEAGVSLTKVLETEEEDTLIIEADKHWQYSPWKLSLYSFYIKLYSYPTTKVLSRPEVDYYSILMKDINEKTLLSKVKSSPNNFIPNLRENHNYSGFVSILSGTNKQEYNTIFGG